MAGEGGGPAAAAGGWEAEYARGGIPSSYRDSPSTAVRWALDSWPLLSPEPPRRALDVGCGGARNATFLAAAGIEVIAFDSSPAAIARAGERLAASGAAGERAAPLALRRHDLRDGLPAADGEIDLAIDVFVYKHLLDPAVRARYRAELRRVLAADGRLLISLAEPEDGYYGSCPPAPGAAAGPRAVLDPELGLGSVLFSLAELVDETADTLSLELAWRRARRGEMHGRAYERRTLATLWRRRDD